MPPDLKIDSRPCLWLFKKKKLFLSVRTVIRASQENTLFTTSHVSSEYLNYLLTCDVISCAGYLQRIE